MVCAILVFAPTFLNLQGTEKLSLGHGIAHPTPPVYKKLEAEVQACKHRLEGREEFASRITMTFREQVQSLQEDCRRRLQAAADTTQMRCDKSLRVHVFVCARAHVCAWVWVHAQVWKSYTSTVAFLA